MGSKRAADGSRLRIEIRPMYTQDEMWIATIERKEFIFDTWRTYRDSFSEQDGAWSSTKSTIMGSDRSFVLEEAQERFCEIQARIAFWETVRKKVRRNTEHTVAECE